MFDIVGKRRWFYIASLVIMIPGLIFLLLTPFSNGQAGLKFSIDFTGGTVWEVHFKDHPDAPSPAEVQAVMAELDLHGSAAITSSGGRNYILIRTEQIGLTPEGEPSPSPSAAPSGSPGASASPGASTSPNPSATPGPSASPAPSPSASPSAAPAPVVGSFDSQGCLISPDTRLGELATALKARFGCIDEVRQEANIGPLISGEIAQQALFLLILGSTGILGWMTFRFTDVRMGASAIAALLHDVIVVLGVFAIAGTLFGLEIDALFVTAMLTVIGFSVHDTIVVFDRIRENRIRHAGEPFSAIVNHSLLQTLGRSLNTSLTVAIVLLSLLLFGSDAIRSFVFAMLVGIISGTYSSIFNASMILVSWHEWDDRRRASQFATARR